VEVVEDGDDILKIANLSGTDSKKVSYSSYREY